MADILEDMGDGLAAGDSAAAISVVESRRSRATVKVVKRTSDRAREVERSHRAYGCSPKVTDGKFLAEAGKPIAVAIARCRVIGGMARIYLSYRVGMG